MLRRLKANWKRWALELLAILGIVAVVGAWQARGLPEGAAPPLQGLRTDGVAVDLASFLKVSPGGTAGDVGGPVLVDFWATWCPVCTAEEGNIARVARHWRVMSVAIQSGDAAAVAKHLHEREVTLPAVVDADGGIATAWKVRGTPTHFVLDADGNIRFRVVGYATTLGLMLRLWWAGAVPA